MGLSEKKIIELPISNISLQEMRKLEVLCFLDQAWEIRSLEAHFQNQKGILIQESGENLAYLLYLNLTEEAEILRIGVVPEQRGKGLGKDLIFILKNLYPKIFLEVHENNTPAIKLYESCQFQKMGIRKKYYSDGGNAILYTYP